MTDHTTGDGAQSEYLRFLYKGSELLLADRIAEAREMLERAASIDPSDAKGLSLLGLVYFRLEEYALARQVYERLVAQYPREASLRVNLGLVYMKQQEPVLALQEMRSAVEIEPGHQRAWGYLGLLYTEQGEPDLAREAFHQAGQEPPAPVASASPASPRAAPSHASSAAPSEPLLPTASDARTLPTDLPREPAASDMPPYGGFTPPPGETPSLRSAGGGALPPPASEPLVAPSPPPFAPAPPPFAAAPPPFAPSASAAPPFMPPGAPPFMPAPEPAPAPDDEDPDFSSLDALDAAPTPAPELEPEPGPAPEPEPEPAPAAAPRTSMLAPTSGVADLDPAEAVAFVEAGAADELAGEPLVPAAPAAEPASATEGVQPIFSFATSGLLDLSIPIDRMEPRLPHSLVLPVVDDVVLREEAVRVCRGELDFVPAMRRAKGQFTGEPLTDRRGRFIRARGHGMMYLSAAPDRITVLDLFDDFMYLRSEYLFAFESSLHYENGKIRGLLGPIDLVHIRGEGRLVLVATGELTRVRLVPGWPCHVAERQLAGWVGRVVPQVVPRVSAGDEVAHHPLLRCDGEGVLLVDERAAVKG